MTIQQVHLLYKQLLDKFDSEAYPLIKPGEIDAVLNVAQEVFIKQRYGIMNTKRKSFEETRKRTDDLKMLVTNFDLALDDSRYNKFDNYSNTYQIKYIEIPSYMFTLSQSASFSVIDCKCEPCSWVSNIKETQTDDYVVLKNDPFNMPTKEYPLALSKDWVDIDFGERINFSKYSVNYRMKYLRFPIQVSFANNITFELSEHTHREIINLAVSISLETIESQRYNTQKPIILEQE